MTCALAGRQQYAVGHANAMFVGQVKTFACSWVDSFRRKSFWASWMQCHGASLHRPLRHLARAQVSKQKANWTLTRDMTWTDFLSPELSFKALCGVLWYAWKGRQSEQHGLQICCTESCTELLGTICRALRDWPDSLMAGSVSGVNNDSTSPSYCLHQHLKCGHLSRKSVIRAQLKFPRPAIILASLSLKFFSLQGVQLHFSKLRQRTE